MSEKAPIYSYKTISAPADGFYSELRSKFIAHAFPVTTEEEAMAMVEEMRKKYYDARHVCWAYRVGIKEYYDRANDDGEPSSTAGKPILGQIMSFELTNVLITVTRYFGGVKLGTSGLIVAYRSAAQDALTNAEIVEHTLYSEYHLSFPYSLVNTIAMLLRAHDAEMLVNDADLEGYVWTIKIADSNKEAFEAEASGLYQLTFKEKEAE